MADPISTFNEWYAHAENPGLWRRIWSRIYPPITLHQPQAAALATATPDGAPSVRFVLFKGIQQGGFTFYTNAQSRKGQELSQNPRAALAFHWSLPERQIRIEGTVRVLSDAASDAYWNSRPQGSRLSAMASDQSRPISSREALEKRVEELKSQYGQASPPRPAHWHGYAIEAQRIEFWEARASRLHERRLFTRRGDQWDEVLLAP